TNIGGSTSHSAIMARSSEIPAVVGTKNITNLVKHNDILIIDGNEGIVLLNPSNEEIERYRNKQDKFARQKELWMQLKNEPTVTKDGEYVNLVANISTPKDIAGVMNNGGEGVGLFRTEFLY